MISVLLAEDMHMIRAALSALLRLEPDIDVVAEVTRGDEIVPAALRSRPDVAVLDIDLPGVDGITASVELREKLPGCRVLVLTAMGQPGQVRRALNSGIEAFLVKDAPGDRLADAIRRTAQGLRVLDPELVAAAVEYGASPLTLREATVLREAARGAPAEEIARRLHLSPGTVRNYLTGAITKTGARNTIDAIRIAQDAGWISVPHREQHRPGTIGPKPGVTSGLIRPEPSDVGDAQPGVGLVAAVDGDEVGGQPLDLVGVAKAPAVHAAHAGDPAGQRLNRVGGLAVVAQDEHVQIDLGDLRVQQQDGRDMVEGGDHAAAGQDLGGLLGGAALLDLEREGALLVEAERVDAVDDDLSGQLGPQGLQGGLCVPPTGSPRSPRRPPRPRSSCPRRAPARRCSPPPPAPAPHSASRSARCVPRGRTAGPGPCPDRRYRPGSRSRFRSRPEYQCSLVAPRLF